MRKIFFTSFFAFFSFFSATEARDFSFSVPSKEQMLEAISEASLRTKARTALLYGLLGQETAYGGNLGKTGSQWNTFCGTRNTEDCRNWKNYDCKPDYANSRHFDDILHALHYVDKSQIPYSSTCALGFTQFEPNTWWQVANSRRLQNLNPWDIKHAVLMAAYYLEDLGADKNEVLGPNGVIGTKDKIALQRYYCGGNYTRPECVWYANGVEAKARRAPASSLQGDLQNQLNILRERQNDLRRRLRLPAVPLRPSLQTPKRAEKMPSKSLLIETLGGLRNAVEGVSYSAQLRVTKESNQNIKWSVDSGNLPPGVTLDAKTGIISGLPPSGSRGAYSFIIKVTDDFGLTDILPMYVAVIVPEAPLSITAPSVLGGATQSFFHETSLTASGGTPPYAWSIVSGSLPPGFTLISTGFISGRDEKSGSYEFTARVADVRGKSEQKTFRIVVHSRPVIPSDYESRSPKGTVGTPFAFTLPVSGGIPPYIWTITENFPENTTPPSRAWSTFGGPPDKELSLSERSVRSSSFLPAGLELDSSSGIISGRPTESIAKGFTAMVTDSRGLNDTMDFYITIALPSKPITNDAAPDQHPIVLRRQNGDLAAFFKTYRFPKCPSVESMCQETFDRDAGTYVSISADDGTSWSPPKPMVINDGSSVQDYAAITEDRNGNLVLLGRLGGVFTLTSGDGSHWTNMRQVTPIKATEAASSILHAADDYYYVAYHSDFFGSSKADVYLTRSKDLAIWEDSIQVSRGGDSELYPAIFQSSAGTWYAAYSSPADKEITVSESLDGKNWTATGRVKTDPVFADMGLNFVEMDGRPVLIFYGGIGGTSYYSFLDRGAWSTPAKFYLDASYRLDGVVLKDGALGLAHIYYTDYYRDIYFAKAAKLKF